MASRLGLHRSSSERYYARSNRRRYSAGTKEIVRAQPPFMGWCPDLPADLTGLSGFRNGYGVVALPWRGQLSYAIRPDIGWAKMDSANLPRGSGRAGTGLADIRLDSGDYEGYAIHAGVTSTTDISVSRFTTAGAWAAVAKHASATGSTGNRDVLWDGAVFPLGAPTRSTAINQSVLVFAGGSKTAPDRVLVTPDNTGVGSYDDLDRFSSLSPFKARSCESFQGRMHYLNTNENAVAYPRRFRWGAVGTADPDPTEVGAGYYDFTDFKRTGLRCESIGDKIACYFEDGVAFMRPTDIPTNAYLPEIVTKSRGLLSTHALTPVANDVHFGVFDDGFWLVSSTGQWRRVGVINHQGQVLDKFWHAFINELDINNRNRVVVTYDVGARMVRIAYPTRNEAETKNILNIVLNVDGVDVGWPDVYTKPVTMWGRWDRQIRTGTTWANLTTAGTTWASLFTDGTIWQDFLALYGLQGVIQADDVGNVYGRDPLLYTRDGITPSWLMEFAPLNISEDIASDQVLNRFFIRYRDLGGPSASILVGGDGLDFTQSQSLPMTEGSSTAFAQETAFADFKMMASSHVIRMSGTAPMLIDEWGAELFAPRGRDLRGQTP